MKITFDPNCPEDRKTVMGFLNGDAVIADNVEGLQIRTNPEDRQDPNETPTVDCHGMPWNPEIHASTKNLNADGSWKAARGKADEAKQAIVDFEKAQVAETEAAQTEAKPTGGMPGGMPGAAKTMPAPDPEIPPRVIEFAELTERFIGMMESGKITDYQVPYKAAGVTNPDELETNESLRAALWAELDKIEEAE